MSRSENGDHKFHGLDSKYLFVYYNDKGYVFCICIQTHNYKHQNKPSWYRRVSAYQKDLLKSEVLL